MCVSVAKLESKRCRVRYSFTTLKEEVLLSKAEKELEPEVTTTLNLGVACYQCATCPTIWRGQMQKRTSETGFSANFESIHVVSDFIFEKNLPSFPFRKSMSHLRDKMVRSLAKRSFKTQAFELYMSKNTFLKVADHFSRNDTDYKR